MNKNTLARAKELEEDINEIRMAMTERSDARHFAMLEHYGYDARRNNLPKWLTPKIMTILGEERERLEHELENLTDDSEELKDFEPTGKYNVEPKADEVENPKQQSKRFGFWRMLFFMVFVGLVILCGIQFKAIRGYQQSEAEWVELSKLWREKLDTCMNRNERIYNQLYEFQDIRIKQLKEQKEGKK